MDTGIYYIVVRDGVAWLVVEVIVDGPAAVVGRWTDKPQAEEDCRRWTALAADIERRAA